MGLSFWGAVFFLVHLPCSFAITWLKICMKERTVGSSSFGAFVLNGKDEGGITTDRGLPLTSPTVRILGRFQRFKTLRHKNLCAYLDLIRCSVAPNCVIVISEYYPTNLQSIENRDEIDVLNLGAQLADAISFLHLEMVTVGPLRPETVCVVSQSPFLARISAYGIGCLTNHGKDLADSLDFGFAASPEMLALNGRCNRLSFAADIWGFGILLLEISLGFLLSDVWPLRQYYSILRSITKRRPQSLAIPLFEAIRSIRSDCREISRDILPIISKCLCLMPSERPSILEVRRLFGLKGFGVDEESPTRPTIEEIEKNALIEKDYYQDIPIDFAFTLWKLSGSGVESILVKQGVIQLQLPIMSAPSLVVEDLQMFGNDSHRRAVIVPGFTSLPSHNLRNRIQSIDKKLLWHSIELDGIPVTGVEDLPVVVKERDMVYQFIRTNLFHDLLLCTWKKDVLRETAISDIPPAVRAATWASLLGVEITDCDDFYELDVVEPHSCDKQLDVDIPRCHQYDELMTSPAAHWRLRLLIKAWLLSSPQYVYWQGCDSLSTPFLLLNFNNLPVALKCLTSFIDKYLFNFFLKDNAPIIQEYLAIFHHLLAFTDANLYAHLVELDFYPELFAIPWFLTCFAHVLPVHKLLHVWDRVLLHDSSFPLFIGLSLLNQLRHRLIESTFNDAILLFSDLPEVPVENLISDSLVLYESVPSSCTIRINQPHSDCRSSKATNLRKHTLRPLKAAELRTWHCPRISREDFILRCEQKQIVVVDIRSVNDFAIGHVLGAVHCPMGNTVDVVTFFDVQEKNRPICVVGGKDEESTKQFCSKLVLEKRINGVCVLDGGFAAIRDAISLLVVD